MTEVKVLSQDHTGISKWNLGPQTLHAIFSEFVQPKLIGSSSLECCAKKDLRPGLYKMTYHRKLMTAAVTTVNMAMCTPWTNHLHTKEQHLEEKNPQERLSE